MRSLLLSLVLALGALGLAVATPSQARADQLGRAAYVSGYTPVAYHWRGGPWGWRGRSHYVYPGYGYSRGFYPGYGYGLYGSRYYGYYPWQNYYYGGTPYYGGMPYYNNYYSYPGYYW